jgi:2-C-methyl-D-erythritol 2,4-cyclodiphosphate synthase
VEIPYERGLDGHSDADVALHALMDALLGAAALGDIGLLFPDTDMRYQNISSVKLLTEVMGRLGILGYSVVNADICIVAQRPKLMPHRERMREILQGVLLCDHVNVKATTTEGLGFEGEGLGISAYATCLIAKQQMLKIDE